MKSRLYTTLEIAHLTKLLKEGLTYTEIAKELNRTVNGIRCAVNQSFKLRDLYWHKKNFTPPEKLKQIKAEIKEGKLTIKQIATKHKVSYNIVWNARKRIMPTLPVPTKHRPNINNQKKAKLKDLINQAQQNHPL